MNGLYFGATKHSNENELRATKQSSIFTAIFVFVAALPGWYMINFRIIVQTSMRDPFHILPPYVKPAATILRGKILMDLTSFQIYLLYQKERCMIITLTPPHGKQNKK